MTVENNGQENQQDGQQSQENEYSSAFAEASSKKNGTEEVIDTVSADDLDEVNVHESGKDQATNDEVPEEFQNTHHYKSMFGRIEKERLAREAAEEKVRRYEASQKQAQHDKPPVFEKADIPEELKEDVGIFKKDFPEFAELVELKGKEGDNLRTLLADYGPVVASVQAKNLLNDIKMQQTEARREQEEKRRDAQAIEDGKEYHRSYVFDAHPDIAKMEKVEIEKFIDDVEAWAKKQPYEEATELLRIHKEGSPKETAELFKKFKESGHNKSSELNTRKRQQTISDGLAVPLNARSSSGRFSKKSDPDDYSGAFAEAVSLKRSKK